MEFINKLQTMTIDGKVRKGLRDSVSFVNGIQNHAFSYISITYHAQIFAAFI